jgi:hypothetical protein
MTLEHVNWHPKIILVLCVCVLVCFIDHLKVAVSVLIGDLSNGNDLMIVCDVD